MKRKVEIPNVPIIERFPFPLKDHPYRYSNNSQALNPPILADITPEYRKEVEEKRRLLSTKHHQTYQSFPETISAQWEILDLLLHELSEVYPNYFRLKKDDEVWTFYNDLLGEQETFQMGNLDSLPYEPLDFIGRHLQEDLLYLRPKDGELYLEAGQLCFPGNWSIGFNLGRSFQDIHSAVPTLAESGLAKKINDFLMRIEIGKPWVRYNWSITAGSILHTAADAFDEWGQYKEQVTADNVGDLIHIRVEDQRYFRMPKSNGILQSIHTHLLPLKELKKKREWEEIFYHTLLELPDYMSHYKGFMGNREKILHYLQTSRNNIVPKS